MRDLGNTGVDSAFGIKGHKLSRRSQLQCTLFLLPLICCSCNIERSKLFKLNNEHKLTIFLIHYLLAVPKGLPLLQFEKMMEPDTYRSKNVYHMKPENVERRDGEVFTGNLMEMNSLRRSEQFKNVLFSDNMSSMDVRERLEEAFPELSNTRYK